MHIGINHLYPQNMSNLSHITEMSIMNIPASSNPCTHTRIISWPYMTGNLPPYY